ncbi:hypothetical protein ACJX0J_035101, partial [Zea mays]
AHIKSGINLIIPLHERWLTSVEVGFSNTPVDILEREMPIGTYHRLLLPIFKLNMKAVAGVKRKRNVVRPIEERKKKKLAIKPKTKKVMAQPLPFSTLSSLGSDLTSL